MAVVVLSFTGGYFFGFDKGVESTENPKGNGSQFFMECFDDSQKGSTSNNADLLLYHSTLDCPNIRYGTERDGYGYLLLIKVVNKQKALQKAIAWTNEKNRRFYKKVLADNVRRITIDFPKE